MGQCRRTNHNAVTTRLLADDRNTFICVQLSGKLDVETVLTHAEALAEHAGPRGRQLLAPLDAPQS